MIMKLSKTKKNILLLIIAMVFVFIVVLFLSSDLSQNDQENDQIIIDNELIFKTDLNSEISEQQGDISFLVLKSSQGTSCTECHEEFNPFSVELDIPNSINPDQEFEYSIIVTNDDSETPHSVESLEAILTGIGDGPNDPYSNTFSGSVRRFQADSFDFPVDEGATEASIVLTGSSGIGGLNDVDLRVTSANGQSWTSTGSGVDEEILLSYEDIAQGGYGDYTIQVQYANGLGSISYSVEVSVEYSSPDLLQVGSDLAPNDSHTFSWTLLLTDEELQQLGSEVSGTVEYSHDGGNTESFRYTFEVTFDMVKTNQKNDSTNSLLESGRIIGLFTLLILAFIMILGFSKSARKIVAKPFKINNPQNVHCLFSMGVILFALVHATLLIMGPYSWNSSPNVFGTTALILFAMISFSGFYRNFIINRFGVKNWKLSHLILSIIAVLIIAYHALTFGGHFS
jgi:hypothetical protein